MYTTDDGAQKSMPLSHPTDPHDPNTEMFRRKQILKQIVAEGNYEVLELKVLSSAHLEKDFTITVNPMGIIEGEN